MDSQSIKSSYPPLPKSECELLLGMQTSAQFVSEFKPPEYLIDGICQRGFIYSMTGMTGAGKTAVLLRMLACVALGQPLGDIEVQPGRVMYLAGENPDDVRMRWKMLTHLLGVQPEDFPVAFRPGVFDIESALKVLSDYLTDEVLVIIDTAAAFFPGDDENSNTQTGKYARMLRSITQMKSKPVVLVASHPVKNASASLLLPRGGGAFLNEVDGNLTVVKDAEITTVHWQGKYRGPEFDPIEFKLEETRDPILVDSKGRQIPTVVAHALTTAEGVRHSQKAVEDENFVLQQMAANLPCSISEMARNCGWFKLDDKRGVDHPPVPHKRRMQSVIEKLKKRSPPLVEVSKDGSKFYVLTNHGHEAVKAMAAKAEERARIAACLANGATSGPTQTRG